MNEQQKDDAIKWLSSKLSDGGEPTTYNPEDIRRKCGASPTGLHTFSKMRSGNLYCVYCNYSISKEKLR